MLGFHFDVKRNGRENWLMVTSPSGLWSILSMPLGPREVRRMRATALPAEMLAFWASRPLNLLFCSCSFRMRNGLPYSSKASAMTRSRSRSRSRFRDWRRRRRRSRRVEKQRNYAMQEHKPSLAQWVSTYASHLFLGVSIITASLGMGTKIGRTHTLGWFSWAGLGHFIDPISLCSSNVVVPTKTKQSV